MYHTLIEPLAELRERMRKHQTSVIAQASGKHPNTVRQIRNGVNLNATIGTLSDIGKALDKLEGK